MLVLTRKRNESIIVGDRLLEIKVIDCSNGIVRLGFEAPKELSVYREEIYDQIQTQASVDNGYS